MKKGNLFPDLFYYESNKAFLSAGSTVQTAGGCCTAASEVIAGVAGCIYTSCSMYLLFKGDHILVSVVLPGQS